MEYEDRPYQTRTVEYVRDREKSGRFRSCIQAPTGSGKGVCIAKLLKDDVPQLLLTHRRILLDQLAGDLNDYGIPFGFRASGRPWNPKARIQLGMIQSEWSKAFGKSPKWALHPATRVHVDELHAHRANVAQKILNAYYDQGASIIGWTATPVMVAHMVDELFVAATVPELIADGWLVPPVVYTPNGPDADTLNAMIPQINGEYSEKQLANLFQPKVIFADTLQHYYRLNPMRKPAALFAPGVAHSLWFAQRFAAAGVPAAHIDGKEVWVDGKFYKSDSKARADIFARSEGGELKMLCNRFCLREGWDAPWVEFIALATALGSRAAFVQVCGRGLRPSKATGKTRCVFLDHGANFHRFPQLDDPEPWDMGAPYRELAKAYVEKRREGTIPEPLVCPKCFAMRMSGPECPECKHRSHTSARQVRQLDGSLRLATGPMYKKKAEKKVLTDEQLWKGYFWGARKNGRRSFHQVHAWVRQQTNRPGFPRNLKLMPRHAGDWSKPVADVSFSELI